MPSPEPTAKVPARALYDKYLAFLAANNPHGYLDELPGETDEATIGGILVKLSRVDGIQLRRLKYWSKQIVRLSEKTIIHAQALELTARALGYADYHELSRHYKNNDAVVANRRIAAPQANRRIFTQERDR